MASADRKDVVIFGASGFTGERVVRVAIRKQRKDPSFTISIAGRSADRLREVLDRCKRIPGLEEFKVNLIEADLKRPDSIRDMCAQAKVLINCVGPYRFYGEPVVKACIEAGTHYVDISGEPQFLEKMQLDYNDSAKARGVYVVGSCGFDSIPSEMGIAFAKKEFPGDLESVETYMSFESGPEGAAVHYGTWESAVHSISTSAELGPLRKQLFTQRLPKSAHKVEQKVVHFSEDAMGWSIPFPGSDRSVARRTDYLEFFEQREHPTQVISYLKVGSIFNAAKVIVLGALFSILAKYKVTRDLLLKYPSIFSLGMFSHEGPTEAQILSTRFHMKVIGKGYPFKFKTPEEVSSAIPDRKIIVDVSGPEPGYAATSAMVFESAMVLLTESEQPKSKIPRFGVLTPGYAFRNTDLINRLNEHGIAFEVVSRSP